MSKFDHESKHNLGRQGYRAMLVDLPAALKEYEGAVTCSVEILNAPDRKGSGIYNISAILESDPGAAPLNAQLRGKYLKPMVDRSKMGAGSSKLELAKLSKSGYYKDCVQNGDHGGVLSPGDSNNNRSSVRVAYHKFIQQLRQAVGKKGRKDLCDLLKDMDDDSNGAIDKHELLLGAHTLGIAITPTELDLIWPLFGPVFNQDGNIDINSFMRLFATNRTKCKIEVKESLENTMISLQMMNRHARIEKKSQLSSKIKSLSTEFRLRVLAQLQEMGKSCDEAFHMLDTDRGGTIDKSEFFRGLTRVGIKITDSEMDTLWPLFNLDLKGHISKKEWSRFFDDKISWSYRLLEDRFSSLEVSADRAKSGKSMYEEAVKGPYKKVRRLLPVQRGQRGGARVLSSQKNTTATSAALSTPRYGRGQSRLQFGKKKRRRRSILGVSPKTHKAFGGSGLLYRRQSITRGFVSEPIFSHQADTAISRGSAPSRGGD
jgi:Ca2+-binding EF-hand superfamily protein